MPQASAVVPGAADAEPVAIPADHLNMVKFASREDVGYEKVSGHLQLLAEDAPVAIIARWEEQDRMRKGKEPAVAYCDRDFCSDSNGKCSPDQCERRFLDLFEPLRSP